MKVKSLWRVLILLTVAFLSFNSEAAVFTVTNPTELQDALDEAAKNGEDDVINLIEGTYSIESTLFYIPVEAENYSLTIMGENPVTTILDGNNSTRILFLKLRGVTVDDNVRIEIKNLTFKNGFHRGSGGAIDIEGRSSTLNVENCRFLNNNSPYGGAIFLLTEGDINIKNSAFIGNTGKVGGTILYLINKGHLNIESNLFKDNYSEYDGGAFATYLNEGSIVLKSNRFEENFSNKDGGSVFASIGNSSFIAVNNIFLKNTAINRDKKIGEGGALYINSSKGKVYLVNNSIVENTAYNQGGGVYLSLYYEDAHAFIYNNIIRENKLEVDEPVGEDLFINNDYTQNCGVLASLVELYNNNLGENADVENPNSEDLFVKETSIYSQGNNISEDPMFVDLTNGNLHLKANSPCINSGNNDILTTLQGMGINIGTDIDGDERIIEEIVDIGADEYTNTTPNLLFIPELLQFGEFNVGDEPVIQTLTITNNDTRDVSFKSIYIWGIERKAYKIVGNNCIGNILNSGGSCEIDVQFTPYSVGQKNAFIVVRTLDANNSKFIIKLRATVRSKLEPNIEAEPSIINFGNVKVETASIPETIQVTNTGDSDLKIHKIKIYGINANEYTVDSENCTQTPIAAGSSCEISVIFIPQSEGDKKGTLIIYSNDPDNFDSRILLRGTGIQN